ncbi:urease accessory protein UreF [Reichenbachiella versicolor]|uniref:urease accessory protein UreF n=1 Tax=Reichenbachiella versicolor TaxID=1821036 RepID=UPI000D6DEBC8|nr:urease accessory UreF family protein [Reichenbachiella versicolor]
MSSNPIQNEINLYQLSDSMFPIGGFVYSLGMESAVKFGHVRTSDEVYRYLLTCLDQMISFDFPFIDAGYTYIDDANQWIEIVHTYEAMLINPSIHKSSVVLGKNWIKLVTSLYESKKLTDMMCYFDQHRLAYHQVIILGLGGAGLGIPVDQIRQIFAYTFFRDQISALTRLGTLGPKGGQLLLTKLLKESLPKLKNYQTKPYHEASKSAYLLEVIQLNHDKIYSKLFQN